MNIEIRNFKRSEFETVVSWWNKANEQPPVIGMMPEDTTFIAEINGRPSLCVTLYLTNSKEICYVENFVGNPDVNKNKRKEAAKILSDYIAVFAGQLGYKRMMCMCYKEPLVKRYQELGYTPTLNGVTTFIRPTLGGF